MEFRLILNRSYILAGMVALAILFMPITISLSFAQTSITPLTRNSPSSQEREHIVKITSPSKGQQVIIGNDLTITGTSSDNTTKDCSVSVIVNGIKPYHNATGNGAGGEKDFSKWSFVLTPAYTDIKQGQNKITARFLCANDPNLAAHNSVNVTGAFSVAQSASPGKQQATNISATALLKNASIGSSSPENTHSSQHSASMGGNGSNNGSNNATNNTNAEMSNNLSIRSGAGTGIGTGNESESGNTGGKIMSVSVHFSKKSVQPGDEQTVSVKVTNANSSSAISGASVLGSITDPSGGSFKKLGGTTDSTGKSSYSWTVSQNDATGKYKTVLDVSAPGYENTTATKTFVVVSLTSPTSDTTHFPNFTTGDHHSNSPSTIIPIPHIRIPVIKIPFHLPFH